MELRQVYDLPEWGKTDSRVLDAAERLIISRGLDGLTITSIATEAEVSRPTVYRRWPSVDEILRATLLRRTTELLKEVQKLPVRREDLVATVIVFATQMRTHPLFRCLIDRHPDVFTRYSVQRLGASQLVVVSWLADAVESCQQNGSVRGGNPNDMGVVLLLMAQSMIISHETVAALIGDAEFNREMFTAFDGYLKP